MFKEYMKQWTEDGKGEMPLLILILQSQILAGNGGRKFQMGYVIQVLNWLGIYKPE